MPSRKPTSPRTTAASMVFSNASTSAAAVPDAVDVGFACRPETAATTKIRTHAIRARIKPPTWLTLQAAVIVARGGFRLASLRRAVLAHRGRGFWGELPL